MKAKRLREEVVKRLWGTHRRKGLISSEIGSLFSHIAAQDAENKGLRELTKRAVKRARIAGEDIGERDKYMAHLDEIEDIEKALNSPEGVTR